MSFDSPMVLDVTEDIINQHSYPVQVCDELVSKTTFETAKTLLAIKDQLPGVFTSGNLFFVFFSFLYSALFYS